MKLFFAFLLTLLPTLATAAQITITEVTVSVNSYTFDPEWKFPITLQSGQDLVLTQNKQGMPNDSTSYNFDLSDSPCAQAGLPCEAPIIKMVINGFETTFTDNSYYLLSHEGGNETRDYILGFSNELVDVYFGYADNVHPYCIICWPDPFLYATFFQGRFAYLQPGNSGAPCAANEHATCIDGAVLRIVAKEGLERDIPQVPEPTSLLLFGTGLVFVGTKIRKKNDR